MTLDDSQKQVVATWIQEGLELSDIQRRLADELDIHLTYMEVRFLVGDLELTPKDTKPEPAPEQAQPESPATEGLAGGMPDDDEAMDIPTEPDPDPGEPALGGDVSVTVDTVVRPGAMVSGKVTFSDGETCGWQVDQLGRMGIIPDKEGYRPPPEDMRKFSLKLQETLQRGGF